jgi:DNA polymerase
VQQITFAPTFAAWQKAARRAMAEGLPPHEIAWEELGGEQPGLPLFDESDDATSDKPSRFRVPKEFVAMARRVTCHRDPRRWAMLYSVLWRLTHGEPKLLEITVDPEVNELTHMDKGVRHDVHKMRAFVRFRLVEHDGAPWYVAWFEPEHHIVEFNAPFFRDRFAQMHWSILTPERCVHWDGSQLSFTEGVPKSESPAGDEVEALWRNYYGHIFNPARVKVKAMQSEMPKRYWKNLPEAAIIPALLSEAPARVKKMRQDSSSKVQVEDDFSAAVPPSTEDWEALRKAARGCRACPLWRNATQTVFGEGPLDAPLVIVGEQPGDGEDVEGRPFVGPAGKLLDRALADAGVDRGRAYVTNAVKHFKWEPRGKRRLHQKPNSREVAACRPWFAAEIRVLKPKVLLCLGGTAASSVLGRPVRVLQERGQLIASSFCRQTLVTVHPSMLLRLPNEEARASAYAEFVADLRMVLALL